VNILAGRARQYGNLKEQNPAFQDQLGLNRPSGVGSEKRSGKAHPRKSIRKRQSIRPEEGRGQENIMKWGGLPKIIHPLAPPTREYPVIGSRCRLVKFGDGPSRGQSGNQAS